MTVRLYDELDDLEKLGLIDISYSRLDTFNSCNARYFYTYIVKEDRLFGEAATLGNIVHSVLENTLEPDKAVDFSELLDEFLLQKEVWDPDHAIKPELIDAGKQMLAEFVDKHEGQVFPIESKEKKFEVVIGRGLVRGYIDRVDIVDDIVRITDYKTGRYEVTFKDAPNNLQLGIYALAMAHEYPDKKVYAELYYLRTGRQKGHLFTKDDLEVVERRVAQNVSEILEKEYYSTTPNPSMCYWCDFSNGICATGTNRVKRQR